MFEHFDAHARQCVALAEEEARRLGHDEVATVHLLLGIARVDAGLLDLPVEPLRAKVVELFGNAAARADEAMPVSAEAKAALEGANTQALKRGHTIIGPADLLLALLVAGGGAARTLRETGAKPADVRKRASAAAQSADRARPAISHAAGPDHEAALRGGHPVSVTLGDDAAPIGDLGSPRVDARLLSLMLLVDTPAARFLRARGIDQLTLRAELLPPDGR
jgi:ATP-dependent Clp protease ATP-binding subunit ClpA